MVNRSMKPAMMIISAFLVWVFMWMVIVDAHDPVQNFDWKVSFATRALLGQKKKVIVINDQFPGPLLNTTTNNLININIYNELDEPFLMTWNGVHMRKNSWQDGMQQTNCPILPGRNWTYSFQVKDQIGSFFYFPSLGFHKAAGGFGPIRINNRDVISIPFPRPDGEYDILIGDWHTEGHKELRYALDNGRALPLPDGILINGVGPNETVLNFEPGHTYRLRISNVGLKATLNFRIEGHDMLLVEAEGSYLVQQHYKSVDIHVGQSYSVLVTAKNNTNSTSYFMVASSRFLPVELWGIGIIAYSQFPGKSSGHLPLGPAIHDYNYSLRQARSMRWDLSVGAARPNPQGSFHYGSINITRTIVLTNDVAYFNSKLRHTVNGVSFVHPSTPLMLADYFNLKDVFQLDIMPHKPGFRLPFAAFGASVIDAKYHDFVHIVFQNTLMGLQTWHINGHNFFVVGMGFGMWNEKKMKSYNMVDALSRSTIQVYPLSWTAVMVKLDNMGIWNLRSQDAEGWYLGQELYIRVKGNEKNATKVPPMDEVPMPNNVLKCGLLI